jgi:hypothetical protein
MRLPDEHGGTYQFRIKRIEFTADVALGWPTLPGVQPELTLLARDYTFE